MSGCRGGHLLRWPADTRGSPSLTAFTPDTAIALGGPDWAKARRASAAEQLASTATPIERMEIWRYSRIDELDLDAYAPVIPGATALPIPGPVESLIATSGPRAGLLVEVDGTVVHTEVDPSLAERGVRLGSLVELGENEWASPISATSASERFEVLNLAFGHDPVLLRVPDGIVVEQPFLVFHWLGADAAAVCPRTTVRLGRDSQATVVDRYLSADVSSLSIPVSELEVGEAARLRYLAVQEVGPRVWQIGHQVSVVERDATLQSGAVALGGDYARLRTDSRLVGRGASSELLAVYFAEHGQMHDFRTLQEHLAPNTRSELLFKGAVQDRARGVYSGLIHIGKDAAKSDAVQTNRNLVLSEGAHAESVPNLEIENNDVRCSHATAVGPIDDEQLYYVESRGLPPEAAERLIVLGFFREVLARLPVSAITAELGGAVSSRLVRRVTG